MGTNDIYNKTEKGKGEIQNKTESLSMLDRRVLILMNGEASVSIVRKRSRINDFDAVLNSLKSQGFIELISEGELGPKLADLETSETEIIEPVNNGTSSSTRFEAGRDFMINTLATFCNRVRVTGLIGNINATDNDVALTGLIPDWYQAISETPNGMYQADDLKADLIKMLDS